MTGTSAIDFGQFRHRISTSANFDFGQSISANFWMLNFGTTKCGALEGWGPEGWGTQNFALFFPLPPQFFILHSLSRGHFVEFWWCLKRRDLKCARLGLLDSPRAQMCTFQGSGLQKHQQKATKGPQEGKKNEIVAGRGKKRE